MGKDFSAIKSFSMAEMLVVMVIIMVLLVTTFPLITFKKKTEGMETTAIACIKNVLASTPSYDISESTCSSNSNHVCCLATKSCQYNQNNSCSTLRYFADRGKTNADIYAARKMLREVCDRGGKEGCRYFVDLCNQDSTSCDISNPDLGVNFDLAYYLALPNDGSNGGMGVIEGIVEQYYNNGYTNITSKVGTAATSCTCPIINLACLVKGTSCSSEVTPSSWAKRFGGTSNDNGFGVEVESGSVYITGSEKSDSTGNYDIYAMKLDIDGNVIWKKKFGGASDDQAWVGSVDSGNFYIAGSEMSDTTGGYDVFAIKLDTNGNVVWKKKFGGTANEESYAISAESGNAYLTGYTYTSGNYDVFAMKLDLYGNVIWNKKFGGAGEDQANAIGVESGNVYLTGEDYSDSAGASDLFAIKLDTNGNVIWKKKYGGALYNEGYEIVADPGNVYVTGLDTDAAGSTDLLVMKLDTNGNVVWKKKYGGTDSETGYELITESGNIYVSATIYIESSATYDLLAMKLDTNGNVIWKRKYGGAGTDFGYGMAVDSGSTYLTGYEDSDSAGLTDIYLIKMPPNPTSNISSGFNVSDLDATFNGSNLNTSFNASNLTFTTGNLSASFNGANLNTLFDGIALNSTKFLGVD